MISNNKIKFTASTEYPMETTNNSSDHQKQNKNGNNK